MEWVLFRHSHKFGSQTNLFWVDMCSCAQVHSVHSWSIFQLCLSIAHRISCVSPTCPSWNVINTCAYKQYILVWLCTNMQFAAFVVCLSTTCDKQQKIKSKGETVIVKQLKKRTYEQTKRVRSQLAEWQILFYWNFLQTNTRSRDEYCNRTKKYLF